MPQRNSAVAKGAILAPPGSTRKHAAHLRPMLLVVRVDLTRELAYGRHCEGVELPDVGGVDRYTHPTSLGVHRCCVVSVVRC